MRLVVGLLAGVLGMLAGWFALALFVISVSGPDRDGGVAMGAFFGIGPIGGLVGFAAGIYLFTRFGLVHGAAPDATAAPASRPRRVRLSVASVVLSVTTLLALWVWIELLR